MGKRRKPYTSKEEVPKKTKVIDDSPQWIEDPLSPEDAINYM